MNNDDEVIGLIDSLGWPSKSEFSFTYPNMRINQLKHVGLFNSGIPILPELWSRKNGFPWL